MTATEMNMSKSGTAKAPKTLDAAITQQYAKYTPILGGIYQQALQNGLLPQTKALLNRMQSTQLGTANILSHLNGNRYDPGLAATLVGLSTAGRRLATNITASNDAARTNMLGQLQNLATGQAGAALNSYSSYQNALAKNADATAAAVGKIGKVIGDGRVQQQKDKKAQQAANNTAMMQFLRKAGLSAAEMMLFFAFGTLPLRLQGAGTPPSPASDNNAGPSLTQGGTYPSDTNGDFPPFSPRGFNYSSSGPG